MRLGSNRAAVEKSSHTFSRSDGAVQCPITRKAGSVWMKLTFDAPKRKVALGGRSVTRSREELLEDARREREARLQHKERTGGALRVQAAWRGARSRAALRAAVAARWRTRFGDAGQRLDGCVRARVGSHRRLS